MKLKNDINKFYAFLLINSDKKHSEIRTYARKLGLLNYLTDNDNILDNSTLKHKPNAPFYVSKLTFQIKPFKFYYEENKKKILNDSFSFLYPFYHNF